MANYSTSEFKLGLKIIVDGDPYSIIDNEVVKPGKGQAFNRIKIKNLRTGRVIERTYKSGESVEAADVSEVEMQYLYRDAENWHFMNMESFEQYLAPSKLVGDAGDWLKEQDICTAVLWNDQLVVINPPNFVTLKIVETDPGIKGDTSGGGTKPAKLETGAVVKVPLFVQEGELVKVDTRTGDYVSRVKE